MVSERPDLGIAIRDYLRDSSVLADADHLGSVDYITVGWPGDKDNPVKIPRFQNRLIINVGRGGQGDIGLGLQQERVDIDCYGTNDSTSYRIWRALDYYLLPGIRRVTSFTRKGCEVKSLSREGGPLRLTDPSAANWPYTHSTYIFTYNGTIIPPPE